MPRQCRSQAPGSLAVELRRPPGDQTLAAVKSAQAAVYVTPAVPSSPTRPFSGDELASEPERSPRPDRRPRQSAGRGLGWPGLGELRRPDLRPDRGASVANPFVTAGRSTHAADFVTGETPSYASHPRQFRHRRNRPRSHPADDDVRIPRRQRPTASLPRDAAHRGAVSSPDKCLRTHLARPSAEAGATHRRCLARGQAAGRPGTIRHRRNFHAHRLAARRDPTTAAAAAWARLEAIEPSHHQRPDRLGVER
jgi:hypothetical protein